ncbi:MAG TPA: tRNA dihydrouridine(20/20a) synthase DusA [Steroidobacteraceae bacterium]
MSGKTERHVSVAPMMDWTDRHCRYFLRGFSPRVLLYTEMITGAAIKHGDRDRLLGFDPEEHPVALQLGGSDPQTLAEAARIGEEMGYDEINLNCGCPSDRVASGSFGACLMKDPDRVSDCVAAMHAVVSVPVTVKMRIGVVDTHDGEPREDVHKFDEADFEALSEFVRKTRDAGSSVSIVHARKAVLGGLSPKDNREIPPLRYDVVRRLRDAFPQMPMVVNGGLKDAKAAIDALKWSDGVMLGREAYHRPFVLQEIHEAVYAKASPNEVAPRQGVAPAESTRRQLAERMAGYAERRMRVGDRLSTIARHMLGLYSGQPGAREYRRVLSEGSREANANPDLILIAADRAERAAV